MQTPTQGAFNLRNVKHKQGNSWEHENGDKAVNSYHILAPIPPDV